MGHFALALATILALLRSSWRAESWTPSAEIVNTAGKKGRKLTSNGGDVFVISRPRQFALHQENDQKDQGFKVVHARVLGSKSTILDTIHMTSLLPLQRLLFFWLPPRSLRGCLANLKRTGKERVCRQKAVCPLCRRLRSFAPLGMRSWVVIRASLRSQKDWISR